MTYIVSTDVVNPAGICLEFSGGEDYTPYVSRITSRSSDDRLWVGFTSYHGTNASDGNAYWVHNFTVRIEDLVKDHIRRAYNLSDDIEIVAEFDSSAWRRSSITEVRGTQQTFETEAEALEYVDTLGNPEPSMRIPGVDRSTGALFRTSWRQEIDGVWINRNANLTYTGEQVVIYTINDLINFLALFFGITPEEVPVVYSLQSGPVVPQDTPEPSINCETYLKATIVDVDGLGEAIEIDIDFTGSSIGDVTVTIIDGDPPSTSLENGDGSITISDNGNILMLNDGGTFFLNEFGNVGFYANGDASLTADNQVQLGVGQNSVTVENGSLTIRDETGSATLTAEDINRLKETLT